MSKVSFALYPIGVKRCLQSNQNMIGLLYLMHMLKVVEIICGTLSNIGFKSTCGPISKIFAALNPSSSLLLSTTLATSKIKGLNFIFSLCILDLICKSEQGAYLVTQSTRHRLILQQRDIS